MKNAMQLKANIRKIAAEKNISAQLVLQNYMLERFLERVSLSPYQNKFIIKGGFLLASMLGLQTRATMDLDAMLKNYPLKEETIPMVISEIIRIDLDDGVAFSLNDIKEIREGDEYNGYRISLSANCPPMAVPLKLDISTGDKVTPKEIEYSYKLMFEDRDIKVLAYNLPTILAEKLETVVSRGDQNTRSRDFYDIYILAKLQSANIDLSTLKEALSATVAKRGSEKLMERYSEIILAVRNSESMWKLWENYRKDFDYASDIEFSETCDAVLSILDSLYNQ